MKDTDNKKSAPAKGGKSTDTLSDKDLFRKMIASQFQPSAEIPGGKQLLTSRDLQYRYRDMCTVTVSTVAEVMQELGYRFSFIMDIPYWEVYDKIE